ncbi:MAG TPA: acetate/propionate family kinase [Phycisphaerae bacterium]|nr:acetate/propionate family kinase [Phycisphaerae bacterium]
MLFSSPGCVLIINAGSSSLKFALYRAAAEPTLVLAGKFDRVHLADGHFSWHDVATGQAHRRVLQLPDHAACLPILTELVETHAGSGELLAIGHRVVHGGPRLVEPARVTPALLAELERCRNFAPLHVPVQLMILEAFGRVLPRVPQVACFDTAFHAHMPAVAHILPIPRRFYEQGVRRYGFHGLSYTYLMEELRRIADPDAASGRIVLAHLGNGASMAAVSGGQSVDTTMGFTPAAGLVMSTRPGDLDPGLVSYLHDVEGMSFDEFHRMINGQSGLLGISETSSDVRDLLLHEETDPRAAEALAVFCYQARKWIGALAAAMEGLDTLVFSGGIGENSPVIRTRVCEGLEFMGIALDPARNVANAPVISADHARVTVRVIPTDEEKLIARQTCRMLCDESKL